MLEVAIENHGRRLLPDGRIVRTDVTLPIFARMEPSRPGALGHPLQEPPKMMTPAWQPRRLTKDQRLTLRDEAKGSIDQSPAQRCGRASKVINQHRPIAHGSEQSKEKQLIAEASAQGHGT